MAYGGRELSTEEALAAKAAIDADAVALRNAGVAGSLRQLQVMAYLDRLQSKDPSTASPPEAASPPSPAASPPRMTARTRMRMKGVPAGSAAAGQAPAPRPAGPRRRRV